jgi:hypothetical protein
MGSRKTAIKANGRALERQTRHFILAHHGVCVQIRRLALDNSVVTTVMVIS